MGKWDIVRVVSYNIELNCIGDIYKKNFEVNVW